MTDWRPEITATDGPAYRQLADLIATAIARGVFRPGDRLPTHRALARRMGLPVSTVSRAYAEAEHRGLVSGEVGRGTFVRSFDPDARGGEAAGHGDRTLDLASNYPPPLPEGEDARELSATLLEIAGSGRLGRLLDYEDAHGSLRHRESGAEWIRRHGMEAGPERVLVTSAAHHALTCALTALLQPGDVLLSEALTYPALKSMAQLRHLRLVGVEMDGEGILPAALEEACRRHAPKALFCVPTIQNPTTALMPVSRRQEIAGILERHEVDLLEDDIHGRLQDPALPPISSFVPERGHLVASLSKSVAPGLRVAYLLAPARNVARLAGAVWASTWMTAPLMAEVAHRWITGGTAERIVRRRREESMARQALAATHLGGFAYDAHPAGYHLWLRMPDSWRAIDLLQRAREEGILLSPSSAFAVDEASAPEAVRICLGGPRERTRVADTLARLAGILGQDPELRYFAAP